MGKEFPRAAPPEDRCTNCRQLAKVHVNKADIWDVLPASTSPFKSAVSPEEIIRELDHLPSAPRVLPRLKYLLCDGNTAMGEVVEMIRLDPGIAARVLQFGNSAYFSHGLRCYTVEEAVNRIGYGQIYELVAAAVAAQVLVRPLRTYSIGPDELWQSSIACALAAESLADLVDADRNIAYTIGLLHGLGMVAIDEWAARHQPQLRFTSRSLPLESCEEERIQLGFHQAEVGAILLRLWSFPQVMSEPIRWQYLPVGTAAHNRFATVLHVAKWIRTRILHPTENPELPVPPLLNRLGITRCKLESLVPDVASRLGAINRRLDPEPKVTSLHFPGGVRQIADYAIRRPQ